ncbi:hypothetical protein H4Q26_005148 [Puccinia striiformis f. sp. tritici PST-130]|nr:hypothetical protein H4Q26_005148 [Puccinia striiformis f. sp. tritici PST-130]
MTGKFISKREYITDQGDLWTLVGFVLKEGCELNGRQVIMGGVPSKNKSKLQNQEHQNHWETRPPFQRIYHAGLPPPQTTRDQPTGVVITTLINLARRSDPQDSLGHNSPIQHFRKRQLPTQTGSSPLPSGLFDSPGSNRGLDPTKTSPSRGQLPPTDPSTTVSPASSPTASADPSNNRTPKQAPHKSDDSSSGFGSTTIKTIGIIAAVIAGLFLLWTIIRKWKFSPSKRFAKKLDDYDEDVFAPRPPSFGEKRANDYQAYSIPPPPNTGPAFSSHYPSYLPERTATPHSMMSPQKIPYANDPCGPQGYQSHRLSHVSITQPPAMFEPNPYRLSLGLGNIPHAYPPSDQHKATVM